MTPFTLVVITPVLVAKLSPLLEITDDVAMTPFTVVVSTFPESVVVRELMMLVKAVEIPLTILAKVLVVVERVFELIKLADVVATTPLVVLVKVKPLVVVATSKVLVVNVAMVVVAMTPLIVVVNSPVEVA
jgi:hypothetical protein